MNLITNLQPTKQIMPVVGTLDNPAAGFESWICLTFLLLLSARLDMRDVPATPGRPTQLGVVVALVAAQMLARFLLGRRSPDNHGIQRGTEHLHVVPVGARECRGQGNPVGIREVVPLGAQFAAIGGVFSDLVAPFTGAGTMAESSDWNRQSIPLRSS